MGTVFKKTFTKPLPAGAELFTREGQQFARWKDAKGKTRKSLVTVERRGGHARYSMLETIRQFAEGELVGVGMAAEVRQRHARYFADQAVTYWALWNGPRQRVALDWVDVEFSNLRAGFRWAADQGDLAAAVTIAAHSAMLGWRPQRKFLSS